MAENDVEAQIDEKTQLRNADNESPQENECYTKEELLELSNTPAWNITRKILLVLFWVCWFGMIAWSVIIVVKAPKCKKEPDQAWFTKGAIAQFDCSVPVEEITAQLERIEPGQYEGIMAEGCLPSLADLGETVDDTKKAMLLEQGLAKDIKMIFTIDADGTNDVSEVELAKYGEAAGFVFLNADDVTFNLNATADTSIFIQGKMDIPENTFYYKKLDEDALDSAKSWIKSTLSVNETMADVDIPVWDIEGGVETLWNALSADDNTNPSAEFIISSVLPGGFVVPFESIARDSEEKATFVEYGRQWRREHESLRAISGSTIRWFTRNNGFTRKFDLQPAIEVMVNLLDEDVELAAIRGPLNSEEQPERIYPAGVEDEETLKIIHSGEAQVFVVQ